MPERRDNTHTHFTRTERQSRHAAEKKGYDLPSTHLVTTNLLAHASESATLAAVPWFCPIRLVCNFWTIHHHGVSVFVPYHDDDSRMQFMAKWKFRKFHCKWGVYICANIRLLYTFQFQIFALWWGEACVFGFRQSHRKQRNPQSASSLSSNSDRRRRRRRGIVSSSFARFVFTIVSIQTIYDGERMRAVERVAFSNVCTPSVLRVCFMPECASARVWYFL